ncbi:MAG TPA: TFIIB-type zinc ribbon-containing protein [Candidatus Parcubacteria bacterium]|jgi:transcription initiation factor TFIIB|nr:TFIIB-type zinc ribbon-containing protein [Candidatus Parcubacteria bacterium]
MEISFLKTRCTHCGKTKMVEDAVSGEITCKNCGFVIKEKKEETGPEWREFPEEKNTKSRVGLPSSLADYDQWLTTDIGKGEKDAFGKFLPSGSQTLIRRLITWDERSKLREPGKRNLIQAFQYLSRLKDKLNLSDAITEKAAYIYRKALERGIIRGRSIELVITASLYAACRETTTPRTLKDFSEAANIQRKGLTRSYRLLHKELDLRVPVVTPDRFIPRIANACRVSEKTKRQALEILKKAVEERISAGKYPTGLAAAALYLACVLTGESVTQKEIAEAAGVTEVTVRNRYKDLRKNLSDIQKILKLPEQNNKFWLSQRW